MENLTDLILQLKKDIGTLRTNREKVGAKVLREKYAKPYGALLGKIRDETNELLYQLYIGTLPAMAADKEDEVFLRFIDECRRIIREESEKGTQKRISLAVFRDYDLNEALCIGYDTIGTRIRYEAYSLYWVHRCREYRGKYWSDLIGMWWNPVNGQWEIERDGWFSCQAGLPPTAELVARAYEALKAGKKEVADERPEQ